MNQGRKKTRKLDDYEAPKACGKSILTCITGLSLFGGILILGLSYSTSSVTEEIETGDERFNTALKWIPYSFALPITFFSLLALFAANFIQTRLSTIQVLLKCSISCLLLLWLLIFLISLVVFGFIVCARYISGVDSVDYQGSFFLDKVNTFEAVVYNSCCVQQQTEPFTDSEDYYYYFDSVDYRMPQEILQCPQDPIYLAALCDRLPSSNQLPCTCYNDLELYTSISDSFYSDNCILLTTLADSIFVKEDYSDAEICGLDNDSGFYSPNLFQQTFANMLSQAVLPFAVAVCISALLFFILSCLGCVLLKARDKSLSNQRKRITRRKKFRF